MTVDDAVSKEGAPVATMTRTGYAPADGGLGDFCFARDAGQWHLFHIHRTYAMPVDCHAPGQEDDIGHAVSSDLLRWETRAPALRVRAESWDSAHLWAPTVAKHDGRWYMLYTGMKDDIHQKIGVAVSDDLKTWLYPASSAVIDVAGYDWAASEPGNYTNCRDPYLFRWKDGWLCYYTARHKDGDAVLAVAVSTDLIHWEDRGFVLKRPIYNGEGGGTPMIESPCAFEQGGRIFLVVGSFGAGIRYTSSTDPFDFQSVPLRPFLESVYNFEMLDARTGLFAYANGGYYSCVRFGYVDCYGDRMTYSVRE